MIPYSRQSISNRDISGVLRVLKSPWLTQGPKVEIFERTLARKCGANYAVAVSSGTAGLHLACQALGVGRGDEVITTPNSFVATANSVLYCGGRPVLVDIEFENFNIDPEKIKRKINSKTVGLLPIHFAGHPPLVEQIFSLAKKKGLFVLEDACHALGARYRVGSKWHRVGSCAHSDAAVFSFHPVKSITTGEGGAVLTNRKDLYERMLALRSHGIVREGSRFLNQNLAFWRKNGKKHLSSWYYEMQELGFNYRITDIQCALGISQLAELLKFIRRRRQITQIYNEAFQDITGFKSSAEASGAQSACHLYVIQLELENLKVGRGQIVEDLRRGGLGIQVHYIPIHLQPYYQRLGYGHGDFPICEGYYERCLSLPLYPSMSDSQVKEVVRIVRRVMANRLR